MDFIPAQKSRLITLFFDGYTRLLLKRRFDQVSIKQEYHPTHKSRTIYFLNHNSWWDGLIPLYLNRKYFHQNARAMMEDKQMNLYPFFRRLGAFSINLDNPHSSIRYAMKLLKKPNSALYLYPEGKITPAAHTKPDFKKGLAWLYKNVEDVDVVPIALYMHTFKSSKPKLHIRIGSRIEYDKQLSKRTLTELLEHDLHTLVQQTIHESIE